MKNVYIKKGCDRKIKNGYLWIFSNEIEQLDLFERGALVNIYNSNEQFLGIGYINPNSLIAVRILSFENEHIDVNFFVKRITSALIYRNSICKEPFYRLVYSESDFLPGLIIDRFDNTFVLQINTYGMELLKNNIYEALIKIFGKINIIYKNDSDSRKLEGLALSVECNPNDFDGTIAIKENDVKMCVNALEGQKTGYFYDQRENRRLLAQFSYDKYVVDAFCYIGSYGLHALKGGCKRVDFVDASSFAIDTVKKNIAINNLPLDRCNTICDDVLSYLKTLYSNKMKPDILIIDPPAFVKSKKLLKEGIKGYINLNKWAFLAVKKASLIFTFSCSYHIDKKTFRDIVASAAKSARKRYTIVAELHQAFDHPIHPQMVETEYLKGYVLYVLDDY